MWSLFYRSEFIWHDLASNFIKRFSLSFVFVPTKKSLNKKGSVGFATKKWISATKLFYFMFCRLGLHEAHVFVICPGLHLIRSFTISMDLVSFVLIFTCVFDNFQKQITSKNLLVPRKMNNILMIRMSIRRVLMSSLSLFKKSIYTILFICLHIL